MNNFVSILELLSHIVDNRGKTCPTSETGIPLIATNCIKPGKLYPVFENIRYISEETYNSFFRSHIKPNDILFVNKGTPGKVAVVPNPVNFEIAQDAIGLRCNDKIYWKYLYYQLQTTRVQSIIRNNNVGLIIPHFKKEFLERITIDLIPYSEQEKIGNLLFSLDSKISLNNSICSDLEAMAKQLYDYWFVQFDFPDENGKPYKTSGGKMVWNEELRREIPEGWRSTELGKAFVVTMGSSPSGDTINEKGDGIVFYQGKSDFGFRYPSVRTFTTDPKRYAQKGDTLLSVRAPVGSLNMAIGKCCIGRGIASISSDNPAYTYYTCISMKQQFEIFDGDGTTFGCIGRDELKALTVICPAKQIIKNYSKFADKIDKQITLLSLENQQLTSLRDFLLPMLMNGQVKVK